MVTLFRNLMLWMEYWFPRCTWNFRANDLFFVLEFQLDTPCDKTVQNFCASARYWDEDNQRAPASVSLMRT